MIGYVFVKNAVAGDWRAKMAIRCKLRFLPSEVGVAPRVNPDTGEVTENGETLIAWARQYPHLRPCPKTKRWVYRVRCLGFKKQKRCEHVYEDES